MFGGRCLIFHQSPFDSSCVSSFPGSVIFCCHFIISILVYRNLAVYLFLSHTHYIYVHMYILSLWKYKSHKSHVRQKLPFYLSFLPSFSESALLIIFIFIQLYTSIPKIATLLRVIHKMSVYSILFSLVTLTFQNMNGPTVLKILLYSSAWTSLSLTSPF